MRLRKRQPRDTEAGEAGPDTSADVDEASTVTPSGAIVLGRPDTSAVAPEASIQVASAGNASIDVPAEIRKPQPQEPVTEPTPPTPIPDIPSKEAGGRRWGRRTVTVPVDVPHRYLRRRAMSSRSAGPVKGWRGVSVAPILAIWAGGALAVMGFVALLRAGLDGTWFQPTIQVLDADHTALLALLEIGAGVVLMTAGFIGNRVLVAALGLAMALLATAAAVDPLEVQRELAIERWWAWVLVAVGAALNLAALQAPLKQGRPEADVT